MFDIKDATESQLRNAIWDVSDGRVPGYGLSNYSVDDFRAELARRGLTTEGYHNA